MKTSIVYVTVSFSLMIIILSGCGGSMDGTQIETADLLESLSLAPGDTVTGNASNELLSSTVPSTRNDLGSMRTVVKIFDGQDNAGLTIPGFGGLKLSKNEKNVNVYYIETKVVKTATDTLVYGIGYSAHYLFKKVKRGLDVTNLPSIAASAQIESNRTHVVYSLQSYGVKSLNLVRYFKPVVNANFDVAGFAVMQSAIDGIHNVLGDSTLSKNVQFTPQVLKFVQPYDL